MIKNPSPPLKEVEDGDCVKMVGLPTLHIVDRRLGCSRPDPLASWEDYRDSVKILTRGQRVRYYGEVRLVEYDGRVITFIKE